MKKKLILVFFTFLLVGCNAQELKTKRTLPFCSIKIFYKDTITSSNNISYRELIEIGEPGYWSKPNLLDVKVDFNDTSFLTQNIEIGIEELIVPSKQLTRSPFLLRDTTLKAPNYIESI